MRTGILLAAGKSRRMGRTKQLLPWPTIEGSKPLVAAAFDAVARVCDDMIVVLGHEAEEVRKALGERNYFSVTSDSDAPMIVSVRYGLEAASRHFSQAHVLLQPGDHPELRAATLEKLIDAFDAFQDCADGASPLAVFPVIEDENGQSRGGHPVLIPVGMINQIMECDLPGGLRQFWLNHPSLYRRLSVDDPAILLDLDTPDDYQRAFAVAAGLIALADPEKEQEQEQK